jgi:hypothetical protein
MAITIPNVNRGSFGDKVSGTTLSGAPLTISAGLYGIAYAVCDNIATTDGPSTNLSISDSQGHTWVRLREENSSAGAAADGVVIGIYMALLTNGLDNGTDTITLTVSSAAIAKGFQLFSAQVGGGNTLALAAGNATNGALSSSYSVAISSLASKEYLFVGVAGAEEEVSTAITTDTGYTVLGIGTIGSGTAGAANTNVIARGGYLITTATGDTFDNTGLSAADRATLLVALEEVTPAAEALPRTSTVIDYAVTRSYNW